MSLELLQRPRVTRGPAWLEDWRRSAESIFAESGFPDSHREGWRFTSVRHWGDVEWRGGVAGAPIGKVPDDAAAAIEIANGHALTSVVRDRRIVVTGLAAALAQQPDVLRPLLGRIGSLAERPLAALSAASFVDGVLIRIPAGARVEAPIHVIHAIAGDDTMAAARVLVLLEAGAEATLVETHVAPIGVRTLSLPVTEIALGENARLTRVALDTEGSGGYRAAAAFVEVGRNATFASHALSFGGAQVRHDLEVRLVGEGAECRLDGLAMVDGERWTAHMTSVEHAVPHTTSAQSYKVILDDRATSVFEGRVLVRPRAQKTNASQSNRNLLRSKTALAHSEPRLEIHADDVKCSHGATIGQLDETALFYLRSRGLGESQATALLSYAFAAEIIRAVPVPALRRELDDRLLAGIGIDHRLVEVTA